MVNFILTIIVMMLASYLPRVVPLVFVRKEIKNIFIKSVLAYMPYAVLASLTFPSILYSTGNIITASVGTAVALLLSVFKVNMALVAVVCVGVVYGLGFIV